MSAGPHRAPYDPFPSGFEELHRTKWISLRRLHGPNGATYDYAHLVPTAAMGVTVLPYRFGHEAAFLARVERCPPHGFALSIVTIGGGIEPGQDAAEAACVELAEEGGIIVAPTDLVPLGVVRPWRAADDCVWLFMVDVTGRPQTTGRSDGSPWEAGAHWRWVDEATAVGSNDPKFGCLVARWRLHGGRP